MAAGRCGTQFCRNIHIETVAGLHFGACGCGRLVIRLDFNAGGKTCRIGQPFVFIPALVFPMRMVFPVPILTADPYPIRNPDPIGVPPAIPFTPGKGGYVCIVRYSRNVKAVVTVIGFWVGRFVYIHIHNLGYNGPAADIAVAGHGNGNGTGLLRRFPLYPGKLGITSWEVDIAVGIVTAVDIKGNIGRIFGRFFRTAGNGDGGNDFGIAAIGIPALLSTSPQKFVTR